ncbi:MAG: fused MFS/spermidine synthase [Verrucomicrobia bacterium]|nr:fused MFS/spermidine synthase [Verrucomicrobiota bacterium]
MNSSVIRLVATLLFLFSGVAALIYQVAWQRLLVVFAGGDVYSITIIVTAFMAGLGFGNLAGGVVADRASRVNNLLLFGAAEALIAAFGFASKYLYYDVLYLNLGALSGSRSLTALAVTVSLMVPTFLMGLSLPLLARALIGSLADAPTRIGQLYGVNTFGAALGALAATWVLLPQYGLEGSLHRAAALNAFCALAVFPLVLAARRQTAAAAEVKPGDAASASIGADGRRGEARRPKKKTPSPTSAPSIADPDGNFRRWLVVYGASGFIALALEIVWFRLIGVMLKPTAFTFGTLLAVYLAGLGAGALVGSGMARRGQRPATAFLFMQAGIAMCAGLAVALMLAAANQWPLFHGLRNYLDGYEPISVDAAVGQIRQALGGASVPAESSLIRVFVILYVAVPLALIGPPTFLMGLSFPFLQKAAQTDAARIGRRVGWIQSANIAGSMLGTLAVSVVALPTLGTALTLKGLAVLGGVFGWLGIDRTCAPTDGRRNVLRVALVAVIGAGVWLMPDAKTLWARAHGTVNARVIFAEDGTGVSLLEKHFNEHGAVTVFVNGIGQSWIPYGGIHSALGALPALLHPSPEDVAIIGLGSGDTLYCAGGRRETRRLVCFEIIGAQHATLRALAGELPYPALRHLMEDNRIEHVTGDARLHLMSTRQRFDIIEADALRPTSAHSGNLYSEEYFRLLASRLKPGGLAVTWCPTSRVHNTFLRVFPHVLTYGHVAIGSNEPLSLNPQALEARVTDPALRAHYERAGIDLPELMLPYLGREARPALLGPDFDRSSLRDINTDVFPKDEFSLPSLWPPKPAQ